METSGKKVLLVDDAEVFLELEKEIFRHTGASILTARNGKQALEIVEKERPNVVLLDFRLPDMSGAEVCWQIKSNAGIDPIPVLMVTAAADPQSVDLCRKACCDEFLTKPIKQRQLLQKVGQLLNIPCRQAVRVLVRIEPAANDQAPVLFGTSANISRTGMLIETEKRLEKGEQLMVRFFLPGQHEIEATCEVVRIELCPPNFAYGVRFVDLSAEQQKLLDQFVESRHK